MKTIKMGLTFLLVTALIVLYSLPVFAAPIFEEETAITMNVEDSGTSGEEATDDPAAFQNNISDYALAAQAVDVINVKDYGAVGNGTTDDTTAFLNAISASASQKKPVYVPSGTYKITQTLNLTNQSMFGEPTGSWGADTTTMPVIKPTNPANSGIRLNAGGAISGLSFDYDQNMEGTPIQYAPTIMLSGTGNRVSNVKIYDAWIGIDSVTGSNTGRSSLENVFISRVANIGIRLDGGWDVTSLNNVEVWTPPETYRGHFLNYGTGIVFLHNDLIRVNNTFVFGASVGMLFANNSSGHGPWGNLSNTSVDYCKTGMKFTGKSRMTITGGTFWTHSVAFDVQSFSTELNISGCDLKTNGGTAFYIGDCKHITISGCVIDRNFPGYTNPAIHIAKGWNVIVTGNYLRSLGVGVQIDSGAQSVILTNNIIEVVGGNSVLNNGPKSLINNNIHVN